VEKWLGGQLKFAIKTTSGDFAWLYRFKIQVPDYGDNEVKYTVKTTLNLPLHDYYFLKGYHADDYITDLYWGGLKMRGWEWNCSPYETLYAWGDGFLYPIVEDYGVQPFTFTFGEIWGAGLLDFKVISWTFQRNHFGPPKFYARTTLDRGKFPNPMGKEFYQCDVEGEIRAGSKWYLNEESPEMSVKHFETKLKIHAHYDNQPTSNHYFETTVEIGLGLGWCQWALGPGGQDDIGIFTSLTCLQWETNIEDPNFWWILYLWDTTIDIYSFPSLNITGLEFYPEGDSKVKPDLTAIGYTGSGIMFIFATLRALGYIQPETAVIGSLVGLAIQGIEVISHYYDGQQLLPYTKTIQEGHHYQIYYNEGTAYPGPDYLLIPAQEGTSKNDMGFFKVKPLEGKRCGSTKVVLKSTLMAEWCSSGLIVPYPIVDIEIAFLIPWFIRG
jgi:hypothetical protein